MRKIIILMNIFMGFFMSLVLSLVGTLMGSMKSGEFHIASWLMSFGISFLLSLVIGFLVPIKKLGDKACEKCSIPAQSLKGTLVSAAISDLIYTPVITIIMVLIMHANIAKNAPAENVPPLPAMLISSLLVCLIAGYIAIVIIQPLLIRFLMKNMKKDGMPSQRPEGKPDMK